MFYEPFGSSFALFYYLGVEHQLDSDEERVWDSFTSAHDRLVEELDRNLQEHSRLSLFDFHVLQAIGQTRHQRLRMSHLACSLCVSRSRLTYQVDRLEGLGLLNRQACPDDGRGLFAVLTDKGITKLDELEQTHAANMRASFFNKFNQDELDQLAHLTDRLNNKIAR